MQTSVYLNFNGECEAALEFYAKTLGGKIEALMRWADMPGADVPSEMAQRVMHAHLKVGETDVLAADSPPENYSAPQGFNVTLDVDSDDDAERIFAELGGGGKVTMAMTETFFAHRFGMVTDRFGIPWMVVHGKEPTSA